jgi:DNA-binding GntR family transcriptional regulator
MKGNDNAFPPLKTKNQRRFCQSLHSIEIFTVMSIREKIYKKVGDDISNGKLVPGERLLESKLVKEFRCSQSPVREALRQLETEGLLTFEKNKGCTIRKLSIQEIDDIFSIIAQLESCAARQCTERATGADVPYLRNLHDKLRSAAKKQDLAKWLQINTEYHNFFAERATNKTLCEILENLKRRVYQYRHITIRIARHLDQYLKHHEGMLKGYEAMDGKKVEKYMKLHIETLRDVLISYLSPESNIK